MSVVSDSWWRVACEEIGHPLARVNREQKFEWVNGAWERLTGYSATELAHKTWMEITSQEDVGGDLASALQVIDGKRNSYTMSKRYRHKRGHDVPVELRVIRYPPNTDFLSFIVEAVPEVASAKELSELRDSNARTIAALVQRVARIEHEAGMGNSNSKNSSIINIGSNSTNWIVAIVIALLGVVGYLIYIGGWNHHGGNAAPPPSIEKGDL